MSYDSNLNPVLEKCNNEDLDYLVEFITKTITNSLENDGLYKKYYPDHQKYAGLIASEIRAFGGNTFANVLRGGKGPDYKEIVCDVASKLNAPYKSDWDIVKIEDAIIETVLSQALEKMSDEEKIELLKEIGGKGTHLTGQALTGAFITIFRMGGFKSYQLTVLIVNAILKAVLGHGLSFAGNAMLTKAMSILVGPVGWIITAVWAMIDIAGPATRVTIPAVIYIAMLRKKYNTPVCPHCNQMVTVAAKFCSECGGKLDNANDQAGTDSVADAEFKMLINDTISIPGRGQVCTGKINCGTVKVGDIVDVEYQGGISVYKNLTVAGIEKYRDSLDEAVKDDIVSILLRGDSIEKIKTNMLITKRGKESE